jgi:redox-sensitive bicupin YhaK (pirin superfamily)
MVCHDEHLLGQGQGFETHRHEELEIVTWVVSGAVTHVDSLGSSTTLTAGSVGHLRAGSGVSHSEIAAAPQTRFVQVWLTPDSSDLAPTYSSREIAPEPGALVEVLRPAATSVLSVARLAAGGSVTVPAAALRHVYVAAGALLRSSLAEPLTQGDAFVITDDDAAGAADVTVTAAVATELLVWQFS